MLLVLSGKNLGERQQQLNEKVNVLAKDKIDFNDVSHQPEKSDVDRLFKIDLAAKYKNVEYIMETLKCGDSLYISRALDKCSWLFHKDFIHIVNSDYLSKNIFPMMSIKMRSKVLRTIAAHLNGDDERAISFYIHCMRLRLYNISLKFLFHTPESFKLTVILKKSKPVRFLSEKEGDYLKYFIGDSFNLAESYIKNIVHSYQKGSTIHLLRYMYSVSNEKYLDMLETCEDNVKTLGRRISKHIIQNHKARVMKKPFLYGKILNQNILSRNCTIEDAKLFAVALLPEKASVFFYSNYYESYKFVLDLIPHEDKFSYIKEIFTEKYSDQKFETCYEFYSNKFYNMMTGQEKEAWALSNIANQNDIFGNGKEYLWYKFVKFEKAFIELKKHIIKATDNNKRCEILKLLIDCAKTDEDLTKLLNYYYERHRNEAGYVRNSVLSKLVNKHKVWCLSEDCWIVLEKIFYIVEVFDSKVRYQDGNSNYRLLALIYYIINGKPVPEVLNDFIDRNVISLYTLEEYNKRLGPEKEMIFQYLLQFYETKIKELSVLKYEDDTKIKIRQYLQSALDLAKYYQKTKNDLPEMLLFYIKLDWPEFMHHKLLADKKFSSSDIMHYLKKDAELVVTRFSAIKDYIESSRENLNWLIHKLKVYFAHDISQKYLTLFNECISNDSLHQITEVAVRGILTLANETIKTEFLEKYAPKDKKIDYSNVFSNTIFIQKAICKQIHCSRPPLPLPYVFRYVVGDYVQYCSILFRSFLLNLPNNQCIEFVEWMISKPISIQKHGLRFTFECFDADKLKTIILDSWNKTKNVSLRMILYKLLFMKVLNESDAEELQLESFEVLITLTLDLKEDDDETLFQLIQINSLPDELTGKYLESIWATVSKFTDKPQKFERMAKIIKRIERDRLHLFPEDTLNCIINEHIKFMLDKKEILNTKRKREFDDLLKSKWDLTTSNLIYVVSEKKLKNNLEVVTRIVKQCVEMWDKLDENDNQYIVRYFMKSFIEDVNSKSYAYDEKNYNNVIKLLETILQDLKQALPNNDIYMLTWMLNSSIIAKQVILKSKLLEIAEDNDEQLLMKIRKSGILLGTEFGKLIEAYVQEKNFYWVFNEQMEGLVSTLITSFCCCVNSSFTSSYTDLRVLFCLGLLQCNVLETHMFALKVLPTEYEDAKHYDDYVTAINKIQDYQNAEIQCYLYEKFVNTDFKPRKYITANKALSYS